MTTTTATTPTGPETSQIEPAPGGVLPPGQVQQPAPGGQVQQPQAPAQPDTDGDDDDGTTTARTGEDVLTVPSVIVRPRSPDGERGRTSSAVGSAVGQWAIIPCGSMTNFFATPESNWAYPCGASSREMTVALTAFAICTLSRRIAFISFRW